MANMFGKTYNNYVEVIEDIHTSETKERAQLREDLGIGEFIIVIVPNLDMGYSLYGNLLDKRKIYSIVQDNDLSDLDKNMNIKAYVHEKSLDNINPDDFLNIEIIGILDDIQD